MLLRAISKVPGGLKPKLQRQDTLEGGGVVEEEGRTGACKHGHFFAIAEPSGRGSLTRGYRFLKNGIVFSKYRA